MSEVLQRLRTIPLYVGRGFEAVPRPILSGLVGALVNIAQDALYENTAVYKVKTALKHASDGVIPLASGIVGFIGRELAGIDEFEVLEEQLPIGIANMLRGLYRFYASKKPFAVVVDSKTIEGWNFDPNTSVKILIDGNDVTPENLTTDSNGHFKATLSSEISSGKHELSVTCGKKSFYDVVYV